MRVRASALASLLGLVARKSAIVSHGLAIAELGRDQPLVRSRRGGLLPGHGLCRGGSRRRRLGDSVCRGLGRRSRSGGGGVAAKAEPANIMLEARPRPRRVRKRVIRGPP